MTTIRFGRSPAHVGLGEALGLAATYWRASAERWVLAVAAVALAHGLAGWFLGGSALDQRTMAQVLLPGGAQAVDPASVPRTFAGPLATAIVGVVAEWFLVANAIVGLRGRDTTLAWVLSAGVRSLIADVLIAFTIAALLVSLVVLGAVGLLAMVVLLPALGYLSLRLQFWTLAIFDGQGIEGGLRSSWLITRRSVLRVLGWALAMAGLGLLFTVVDAVIDVALGAAPAVAALVTGAIDTSFSAYTAILLAVLYESQRLRSLGQPATPYPVYRPAPGPGWGQPDGRAAQGEATPEPPSTPTPVDRLGRPVAPHPPPGEPVQAPAGQAPPSGPSHDATPSPPPRPPGSGSPGPG